MIVTIRFHGNLNDLLREPLRERPISRPVAGRPAAKDVIESLGVPHVEVHAIAVDGTPAALDHRVRDGETIDVFASAPGDEAANGDRRFVVDGHLGRLAAYLRMLGFDTAYDPNAGDDTLARLAATHDRILLSRDRGLLKRSIVRRGYVLRSDDPHAQLREVVDRFGLTLLAHPFRRCLRCNAPLEPIAADVARPLVPPRVAREQVAFRRCPACGGLYWRGSHHGRMVRLIRTLLPEIDLR